jgi:gliding motility-associated-like protein
VLTPPCTGGGNPNNQPPVINDAPFASQIEGKVEVDLTTVVSDPDDNLDYSTIRVVGGQTSRGVAATVDGSYVLHIDYSGIPFTGVDRVTIEVCDLEGVCVQQVIDIEVVGEIVVYNGITPDGDGYNDFLLIKYIGVVEGSSENQVTLYNRWGNAVYEAKNYDNSSIVFAGTSSDGKDLPSGTYFYRIDFANGKSYNGYITLKR